jgi:UDP-glucose 4-epimerase
MGRGDMPDTLAVDTGHIGSHMMIELLVPGYDVIITDKLCDSKASISS